MKKELIIILIGLLIVSGLFYFIVQDRIAYREQRETDSPNHVSFINKSDLPTKDFSITWSANKKNSVIYKDGRYLNPKFKEYGHNHFRLYFKDSLYAHFNQTKRNNWHGHHYHFTIEKDKTISFISEGPDAERIYRID